MKKNLIGLIIFCTIFIFATFPRGGLDKIEDANPKYQNPNKHFQNLVEAENMLNLDPKKYDWTSIYLSKCNYYGSDWKKMDQCFFAYRQCEYLKPSKIDNDGLLVYDIQSSEKEAEYQECLKTFKPESWQVDLWQWIGHTFVYEKS